VYVGSGVVLKLLPCSLCILTMTPDGCPWLCFNTVSCSAKTFSRTFSIVNGQNVLKFIVSRPAKYTLIPLLEI
jgi:hypothetical protein